MKINNQHIEESNRRNNESEMAMAAASMQWLMAAIMAKK
jgi:hypothetical protein